MIDGRKPGERFNEGAREEVEQCLKALYIQEDDQTYSFKGSVLRPSIILTFFGTVAVGLAPIR